MNKKVSTILLMVFVAAAWGFAHDLEGKDIAAEGTIISVAGSLKVEEDELYLKTKEAVYLIHLGPEWYSEEIGFAKVDGRSAVIEGFAVSEEIAPVTILVDGNIYTYRQENGLPAWAGRGNRDNQKNGEAPATENRSGRGRNRSS